MDPGLEHRAALRAQELRPARWIATFVVHSPPIGTLPAIDRSGTPTRPIPLHRHEVDGEPDRSEWLHTVVDVGRNGLETTGSHSDAQDRLGRCRESQVSVSNGDPSPRTAGHPVGTQKAGGDGVFVPLGSRTDRMEAFG